MGKDFECCEQPGSHTPADSATSDTARAWNDYQVGDEVYDQRYHHGKLVRLYDFRGIPFAEVQRPTDCIPVDELKGRMGNERPDPVDRA